MKKKLLLLGMISINLKMLGIGLGLRSVSISPCLKIYRVVTCDVYLETTNGELWPSPQTTYFLPKFIKATTISEPFPTSAYPSYHENGHYYHYSVKYLESPCPDFKLCKTYNVANLKSFGQCEW